MQVSAQQFHQVRQALSKEQMQKELKRHQDKA